MGGSMTKPNRYVWLLAGILTAVLAACGSGGTGGSAGGLDPGFGNSGIATTTPVDGLSGDRVSVALQQDGKLVVAGTVYTVPDDDFVLARFNADGSIDTGFGALGTGQVFTKIGAYDDKVGAMALQADGKILVTGGTNDGVYWNFALARYNSDGSLDTGFGSAGTGVVVTPVSTTNNDSANAIVVQDDGKIVVAGSGYGTGNGDFVLVRYNSNGSLDTGFGSGTGIVSTNFHGFADWLESIALQADGKLVAAGYASDSVDTDYALARYNPDGTLDTGFGPAGTGKIVESYNPFWDDRASAVLVQADQKIVVAGYRPVSILDRVAFLRRYNTDGSVDTSYDGTALETVLFTDSVHAMVLQDDQKVVVVGRAYDGGLHDFAVTRVEADGSLDTGFGNNGTVMTRIGVSDSAALSAVRQPDGRILAAGTSFDDSYRTRFTLARYYP